MDLYENPLQMPRYVGFGSDAEKESFFAGTSRESIELVETSRMENSRQIEVPPGVRWVRVAENQSDGWKYRIGETEEWSSVIRASDASMLMENTKHSTATQIQMRYDPPARKLGFAVSGTCLMALAISAAFSLRVDRKVTNTRPR
jgi:hypothetical protein